jgi:hypothetical protein
MPWGVPPDRNGVLLGRSQGLTSSPPRSRHSWARVPAGSLLAEGPAQPAGRPLDYFRAAHEASRPGHQGGPLPPPGAQMKPERRQPN